MTYFPVGGGGGGRKIGKAILLDENQNISPTLVVWKFLPLVTKNEFETYVQQRRF